MKKSIILLSAVALLASCSVNTSGNIDINGNDVAYFKDSRTGLCYGAMASRKTGEWNTSGLGITCVPCEKVKKYIK